MNPNRHFARPLFAALAASVALGALAAPAHAQESAPGEESASANDIVVVARKREERVIDVPIAITALGTAQLAKMGANDLSGVQGAVPNVNIVQGRGSASSANFFIRGIGQPDALQTFDPAVGVYVDGVYLSRIQGALLNLFDVQRVEVLRGPQGTLYGKNTIGGAVNIVSKKPDLQTLKGEIDALQTRILAHPDNLHNASPVGRYQIVRKTLRDLKASLGLSDNVLFDRNLQDMLAARQLEQRGIWDYIDGKISENEFQSRIANEWASIANPVTGRAARGQHLGTTTSQILPVIRALRTH